MGLKQPQTKAQFAGTELHNQNEKYLLTGKNELGSLGLRGMRMLPAPGPDLMVEQDIVIPIPLEREARQLEAEGRLVDAQKLRATATLAKAPLRLHGIPVVGYIDLIHTRGTSRGMTKFEDVIDPPNTVEVLDWKTTKSLAWAKSREEMARTIQMSIYGKYAITTLPETKHVRLSHGYYVTQGKDEPQKVTLRVLSSQIDRQWERVERVASCLVDVAREKDPDKVEANTRACRAYGGCPHRSICKDGGQNKQSALSSVFGKAGADNMLRRINQVSTGTTAATPRKSLISPKKVATPEERRAAEQKIALQEIEAKYPGAAAAWTEIGTLGFGYPTLGGEAARVVGELRGLPIEKGGGIAGAGELGANNVTDPKEFVEYLAQLKTEIAEIAASTDSTGTVVDVSPSDTTAPAGLLPPDAPASDPALASKRPPDDEEDEMTGEGVIVPDAAAAVVPATPPAEPKRGRGRPRKNPVVETTVITAQDSTATIAVDASVAPVAPTVTPAVPPAGCIHVYVNCTPRVKFESLWTLVNDITAELNKRAGEAGDFRLVSQSHDLAYGRWKGLAANMVRSIEIADGHYVLDGASGEVAMIVVETLAAIVQERDGLFVQGAR